MNWLCICKAPTRNVVNWLCICRAPLLISYFLISHTQLGERHMLYQNHGIKSQPDLCVFVWTDHSCLFELCHPRLCSDTAQTTLV